MTVSKQGLPKKERVTIKSLTAKNTEILVKQSKTEASLSECLAREKKLIATVAEQEARINVLENLVNEANNSYDSQQKALELAITNAESLQRKVNTLTQELGGTKTYLADRIDANKHLYSLAESYKVSLDKALIPESTVWAFIKRVLGF